MEYRELEVGEVLEARDELKDFGSQWMRVSPVFFGDCVTVGDLIFRRPISEVEGVEVCDHVVGVQIYPGDDSIEVMNMSDFYGCNMGFKYCPDCGVEL